MTSKLRKVAIVLTGVCAAAVGLLMVGGASGQTAPRRAPTTPTFNKDVAPILFDNCTSCHRKGQVGPFPLTRYQEARGKARMLALVADRRIMPPWKPKPGHGDFREVRRLTDAQVGTLKAWAAAGAPEGRAADLPPLPTFRDGWQLGTPDIVLKMPAPFTVPAEGRDTYVHFVLPIPSGKDLYVRAVECRPGNPRVAHHAIGILDGSGTARKLDAESAAPGYVRFGGPGFLPAGFTPGYVPGQSPRFFDEGAAITIKKGTDFVLQMHYHPTGREETDQTQIGLYLTDKPPTRHMLGVLLGSEEIDIPAGSAAFKASDRFVLPVPLKVGSIWAHMHLIGKEVRVWAELPDGSTQRLLWIDDWDFNWQDTYLYRKPMLLPKGTVLRVESRFDNTANNPRNPNTPPRRVALGEQSTDEMLGVWIGGEAANGLDAFVLLAANVGHYFEVGDRGKKFREAREPDRRNASRGGAAAPP